MTEPWIQTLSLFLANAGLILWFRSESISDWRHMDNKLDLSIKAIQEEIKDFHGRLCAIEEKYKNGKSKSYWVGNKRRKGK